jgi:hypothetical protein
MWKCCHKKFLSVCKDTRQTYVDCVWNVMAHVQKQDFVFRRNGRVYLNRRGRQFSRLQAAEVCASAVVMLDTQCSEVVWRVLATHSIRQFVLHFPSRASPCAITFKLDSNNVHLQRWHWWWGQTVVSKRLRLHNRNTLWKRSVVFDNSKLNYESHVVCAVYSSHFNCLCFRMFVFIAVRTLSGIARYFIFRYICSKSNFAQIGVGYTYGHLCMYTV